MDHIDKGQRDQEFAHFMTQTSAALMRTAVLLTGDHHNAQELVQATLVKVYGSWNRVRTESAFAYARRTMVNQRTDSWRRTGRELPRAELPEWTVPGSDQVEDRDRIVRMLAALPEQQRKVIVLRYFCDLSEAAAAAELGLSVSAVKSLTHRAMTALRTQHVASGRSSS